ncbi:hypothetical protein [uncultured Actinomyces sp.]|uniref:hypothetical protein n=1 Tax=uncultured Actinomyces sp. TaxID=249061 RepID=UPI0028EB50E0|nr:hypothetical protein [uncultured Actinomyces sp.]
MHIPPPGPQRMRCNSLIYGWTLIAVGLLLFPIGGFLLMAGGIALLAYAHKLKQRLVAPSWDMMRTDELDLPAWVIEAWQRWMRRGCLAQRNFCRATRLHRT